MDDATQKMTLALVTTVLRKALTVGGASLATHGLISGNQTEMFVTGGMAVAGILWSFWNDYGRAIVLSQLEVLKAKSLAQAAKLQQHDIAPPTAEQIADKSPTLTPKDVVKVAATLCLLLAFGMLIATPAMAQLRKGPIATAVDKVKTDIRQRTDSTDQAQAGGGSDDGATGRRTLLSKLSQLFINIANFIGDDAEGAIALSTRVPGIQDGHGQQCWIRARDFTAVAKAHPLPLTGAAMTDLEALRLLAIASRQLCEDTHCTQVFTDFKNMATQTASNVGGQIAATFVRAAPSLSDLCVQVTTIPVAPPLAVVPPAPVITPIAPPTLGTEPAPAQ